MKPTKKGVRGQLSFECQDLDQSERRALRMAIDTC